jgi:hypothetical protein
MNYYILKVVDDNRLDDLTFLLMKPAFRIDIKQICAMSAGKFFADPFQKDQSLFRHSSDFKK